MSLQNMNI